MEWSGYAGKVLEVDLTSGSITINELDRDMAEQFVGGKGFGASILYDRLPAGCDPLSPENMIVLATGPLTGTSVAASGRLELCTKGPATNLWLDCNAGGSFGPELKYAGYDVLIITGAASEPVMLVIEDDDVRLVSADEYWGQDTLETSRRLKAEFGGDYRVTCIGQAGELLSPLASVQTEYRSFGRGGAGAVMGSKKLKAIVVNGSGGLRAADSAKLDMMIREAANELANSPDTGSARPEFGTNVLLSLMEYTGIHPNKNFQQSTLEGEPVTELEVSRYFDRSRACFACPIRCSKIARVKEGRFKGAFTEGPEYETVWAFGGHCANKDIPTIIEAEHVCDAYGLDAVSVGNVIGFLMDCWERGFITAEDTAGLEFTWGNVEAMIEAVHLMGKREGPGMDWSMGVRYLEGIIPGAAGLGGHVKGLELPAYDPRASKAMALAYATSDRGGCHLRSWPISEEVMVQNPLGQHTLEFKPEVVKGQQDFYSLINSSGLCLFAAFVLTMEQIAPLMEYATGLPGLDSADKLIAAGERINTLVRLFNLREGLTADQDTIPDRFRTDPLPDGPCKGETVDVAQLVSAYYCLREWDSEGRPTEELLNKLGLAERSAASQQ